MKPNRTHTAKIDSEGKIFLPTELAGRYGIQAGREVQIEEEGGYLKLLPPVNHLARVYIEPTNQCNLDCVTCMRNVWEEPPGRMEPVIFERILEGIVHFSSLPDVFFGGFGEPLSHPNILEMVHKTKAMGTSVELITNGILLDDRKIKGLIDAGLDWLWVSLDGATPESYEDVRLGAALPQVIENLKRMHELRTLACSFRPRLGIAFVAMQRNLADLPKVLHLGSRLGAARFSISNVLAHTDTLRAEVLYERSMYDGAYQGGEAIPEINLPRLDFTPAVLEVLGQILCGNYRVNLGGIRLGNSVGRCPFMEKGSISIRWDGEVSPCLPLLHDHEAYLDNHLRQSHAHSVGNIRGTTLKDLWESEPYLSLRRRLQDFDFSPCVYCNSCQMSDDNREDCFGNILPTCGGCLWAQGIIQCP